MSPSLDPILRGRKSQPQLLVEVLQDIQQEHGWISRDAITTVSRELGVPLMEVFRVAHFYKAFSLLPRGKNVLTFSREHEGLKGLTIKDFTLKPVN